MDNQDHDLDWSRLGRGMAGELILSGDERMVLAGKQYARALPLPMPQALLRCADVDDVRRAIDFVGGNSLPFAVRSGGHCFGDLSSSEGLVIDLSEVNEVAVGDGEARAGPGMLSGDLSRALAAAGCGVPTGGCPLVAIGGLALAGGFGFLGRRHGLTTDRVTGFEVVLADGRVVRCGADEAPDLFWALRGGGALGFGVVTELTLKTQPLEPVTVLNGRWPLAEAACLIEAWQAWAPDADEAVNVELGLVCPDILDEPAFVELFGLVVGEPARTAPLVVQAGALLGGLAERLRVRDLTPVEGADFCVGLLNHQAGPAWLPKRPYAQVGFQATRSHFFDGGLDALAIAECVRRFDEDRRYAQYRELEFVPWRGAYARDDGTAAFLHRGPRMLVRHTATAGARSTPELRSHAAAWTDRSAAALASSSNGHSYQGYAEPDRDDWAQACHGPRLPRLLLVQEHYDGEGLFASSKSRPVPAPAPVSKR